MSSSVASTGSANDGMLALPRVTSTVVAPSTAGASATRAPAPAGPCEVAVEPFESVEVALTLRLIVPGRWPAASGAGLRGSSPSRRR